MRLGMVLVVVYWVCSEISNQLPVGTTVVCLVGMDGRAIGREELLYRKPSATYLVCLVLLDAKLTVILSLSSRVKSSK